MTSAGVGGRSRISIICSVSGSPLSGSGTRLLRPDSRCSGARRRGVAAEHDEVRLLPLDLGEHGRERDRVAVDVREHGHAAGHATSPERPTGVRALGSAL
jgi:hypothetical protein